MTAPPLGRDAETGKHVPALEGVRGVAALLVVLHHFTGPWQPQGALEEWVRATARAGWVGVDLFFVLSGFLITGILVDTRERPGYFRTFYLRRALRIFPLYYGVLAALLVVVPQVPALMRAVGGEDFRALRENQWWYWTYLTNVLLATRGVEATPLVHFWSLAIEEQFYLVWPALVCLLSPRRLLWACVALAVWGPVARAGMWLAAVNPEAMYVLTWSRVDGLAMGAIVALLWRRPGGAEQLARWAPRAALAAAPVPLLSMLWRGGLDSHAPEVQIVGYSALALLSTALVARVLVMEQGALARALSRPWIRLVGARSYAIYVFHFPIVSIAMRQGLHDRLPTIGGSRLLAEAAFVLAGGVASFVVAQLSWHLYEKWFLRLKRLVPYASRTARAPSERRPFAMELRRLLVRPRRRQHPPLVEQAAEEGERDRDLRARRGRGRLDPPAGVGRRRGRGA